MCRGGVGGVGGGGGVYARCAYSGSTGYFGGGGGELAAQTQLWSSSAGKQSRELSRSVPVRRCAGPAAGRCTWCCVVQEGRRATAAPRLQRAWCSARTTRRVVPRAGAARAARAARAVPVEALRVPRAEARCPRSAPGSGVRSRVRRRAPRRCTGARRSPPARTQHTRYGKMSMSEQSTVTDRA